MTETRTLHELRDNEADDFLALYNASFPAEERRPYTDAEELRDFIATQNGIFRIMCSSDESGRLVGFISCWQFDGYLYIEHFATRPDLRGRGLGQRILRELIKTSCGRLLLEVELPENELARRRIRFYEREGFRVRPDFPYIQPPYSPGLPEVPLLLMTHGEVKLDSQDDIRPLLEHVYRAHADLTRRPTT